MTAEYWPTVLVLALHRGDDFEFYQAQYLGRTKT